MKIRIVALLFALTLLAFSQTQQPTAPTAPDKPAACQHMNGHGCCHSAEKSDSKAEMSCCGKTGCMQDKDMKGCCTNTAKADSTDPNSCPGCCADKAKGCSMCQGKDKDKQAKCCASGKCASMIHAS